jgi:hypothetical protein
LGVLLFSRNCARSDNMQPRWPTIRLLLKSADSISRRKP